MTAPVLTWANPGDVVPILNEITQTSEPTMLWSPCDAASRGYRCISCQRQLANVGQVLLHTEPGGVHHLVTWCTRHARWEAAERSQAEAFAQLMLENSHA